MIMPISDREVNIESADFIRPVLDKVNENDLVIFDLDKTILDLPQRLGGDDWFNHTLRSRLEAGRDKAEIMAQTVSEYNIYQKATHKGISVEKGLEIGKEISSLKRRGAYVIALTSRNFELVGTTLKQLSSLNVGFDDMLLNEVDFHFNGKKIVIRNGIIFSNGSNKGEVLRRCGLSFRNKKLSDFSHIHFIDDGAHHCKRVKSQLVQLSFFASTVTHYQHGNKNRPFDSQAQALAEFQKQHWDERHELLSDSEALSIRNT